MPNTLYYTKVFAEESWHPIMLNLTLSHRAVVTLVCNLGADFDYKVRKWKESLAKSLSTGVGSINALIA